MVAMVMLMVIVGGVTRLTESGLSMVDWQPIHGILPPMNEVEWAEELDNYRSSPEYQQRNFGMSVAEFKQIFWLEYIHRVLGRVVGLVFFVPLLFFVLTKRVTGKQLATYSGIFLLGGAQGLLGWYMVKSGLVNEPRVSPLRLSAHLSMACLLFSLLFWQWWKLKRPRPGTGFSKAILSFTVLLFIQIILGAWVAGLDAGLAYDSFPTMNGEWVPQGLWVMEPWWANLWQNATTSQFLHRSGALALLIALIALVFHLKNRALNPTTQKAIYLLIILMIWQITLGALTVIHHVPLLLAALHQFTAILLLGGCVTLLYNYAPKVKESAAHD